MKKTIKPRNIYIGDIRLHCLTPRWYCRFMFWANHGTWYTKRVFKSLEEFLKV